MNIVSFIVGISFAVTGLLLALAKLKKTPFKTVLSLFIFGILLAAPFLLVEYLTSNLKFYLGILVFIAIEFGLLILEREVKCFHDLLHHNVKHLRFLSFVLIGIGFTYAEVIVEAISHHASLQELLASIPLKAIFGIFIHTVLTSLASLAHVGKLFAEELIESVLRFISYYLRIAFISLSHYLYVFFNDHEFSLYILPFVVFNFVFFFWAKRALDKKQGLLPE